MFHFLCIKAKFCILHRCSDVNYLSSTAPPAAAEWQSLLRPLRGREPEGMWNLLSIVREMYRRNDSNAFPLLDILTEEVLACEQVSLYCKFCNVNAESIFPNLPNGFKRVKLKTVSYTIFVGVVWQTCAGREIKVLGNIPILYLLILASRASEHHFDTQTLRNHPTGQFYL